MPYRFRDARIQSGKNLAEAAEELFVSKTTLSNWESGRRVPSVEAIEKLADLYGVSVDYLLGRTDQLNPLYEVSESVDPHMLQFLHECPVYVNQSRWGLVDAVNHKICFTDGSELAFSDVMQISMLLPAFQSGSYPLEKPLTRSETENCSRIWLEPISKDETLRQELRGWYNVKNRFVENDFGQRFYFDTYGNKWLAFHTNLYEIYYRAPADVRDGLISALLETDNSHEAGILMSCLAMQGDDKALETLLELERNPRPWRKGLYVDPSNYAQIGGWTFDKEGHRTQLNFDTCYPMVKGDPDEATPVRIGRAREDTCPHCGCQMVDMLVLDGRDERLKFLGLDGILTATCCPNCVGFLKGPAFNSFTLDGGAKVFPSELFDGAEKTDCYVRSEDYKALTENPFVLGKAPVPLFYGAGCEDVNTVGGFANWVQDAEYTTCPHCGKPMKYLAQIQWDTVMDGTEGTLYIEFCPECQIVSMQHQQT